MTLDEACKVAKAIGQCCDGPVVSGIYDSLNEMFPNFVFIWTEHDEASKDLPWGTIKVVYRGGIEERIFMYDDTL